jgi:hypothetical protein
MEKCELCEQSIDGSQADLLEKMDKLGEQMNWLCENLQSLFVFASQLSASGGGLRGVLSLLKSSPPELKVMEGIDKNVG